MTVTIGSQAASNKPATAIDHQPAAIGNIHADARSSRSPPRSGRQIMDTPSPSTASTTAHAVGYNDEPSITAAPLRSTDDLAVDAGQLSSLILTTEATATPQRIVESVTSLTSSGILAEGQRMPTVRDLARLLRTSPATAPDRPIIDLSKGTPDLSLLPDIRPFLGKLGTHKAFVNSYDGPTILPMLEQILRRNWPYEPEAMTMASGAGDGLAHTMNAFVQPGDFVITEAPEYPLILDMIEAHGAMAFGVPMDGFGMLPDALDRALTMLESQRLAVPHGGHQVSMILLQPRAQNPTGASFSPQRIDALADVLLAHYPNGVGMPLIVEDDHSGDVANAYATSLAQRLPQHVVHIRSFSKSHGPDLRLAALSGPEDAVEAIIAQRRLGSGWVSRFLQEILYEMLADKEAFHTVTNARHIYATRQKTMHALLLRQSLDVHTGDGLNLWIPVRDEPAALRLLAEQGIRVAAGKPFLPSLRISADATGADAGAGAGVDAHASRGIRVTIAQQGAVNEQVAAALAQAVAVTPKTSTNHS
ncbi:aminotransferase class I/II-fold pyridoxal phosphate-dependent enzyme [Bifidobacterium longum]|uniref:aminotransferase class I/II-fold pyridoxal phosphate-dependent enzyme n=1 Tax=Bifidobacterium longum TaxID=216816 RepID=UPI0031B58590